jgi:hypothetical protein
MSWFFLKMSNKYIIEEIVRQFGYLPELYEDSRSEKYKQTLNVVRLVRYMLILFPAKKLLYLTER